MKRQLGLLLACALLVLSLAACGGDKDTQQDDGRDQTHDTILDDAEDALDDTKDALEDAGDDIRDDVEDAGDDIRTIRRTGRNTGTRIPTRRNRTAAVKAGTRTSPPAPPRTVPARPSAAPAWT